MTRKTQLEELIERFNTHSQAKFLLEGRGESLDEIENAHSTYHQALDAVRAAVPRGVRLQMLDRSFLPNFLFGPRDLVVTLGPDGLVVNTAKYLSDQPLLAFNPDAKRMDGVLIPFGAFESAKVLPMAIDDSLKRQLVTMAVAKLDDGQSIFAVNDLFMGQRTHVSARYRITYRTKSENQSSSGMIVSTGAGSSGWYRSVLTGAAGIAASVQDGNDGKATRNYLFDRAANELRFSVREPFISRVSQATIISGSVVGDEKLEIASQMPQGGVIFSDGIESDFLKFESGRVATIGVADRKLNLLVKR